MNMFARFDENPAMTLRVIKETKRYGRTDGRTDARTDRRTDGRTDGQRENSIPPTNKVCGGYKYTKLFTPESSIYQSLYGKNSLSSHRCHFIKKYFFEPNSFMQMFNVSTLYRQHIKLLHQKLW